MTAYMGVRGSDGSFNSTGEGRIVDFDVTLIAHGESGRADEMITAEVGPDLIRGPRRIWDVENNIYQPATAAKRRRREGRRTCPFTFIQDLVAGI